jgi:hypothetical protein
VLQNGGKSNARFVIWSKARHVIATIFDCFLFPSPFRLAISGVRFHFVRVQLQTYFPLRFHSLLKRRYLLVFLTRIIALFLLVGSLPYFLTEMRQIYAV